MTDQDDNLFDDEPSAGGEEFSDPAAGTSDDADANNADADSDDQGSDQSGEEESSEPPSQEEKDQVDGGQGKMIPEHRFKAALKAVTDQLDAANRKIATYEATPVPDKDSDPDGYARHVRTEASISVMRKFAPDYDEVISHYIAMAKENPILDNQVANHPLPAQFAYDIAKEDMEINRLRSLKDSEEFKEFMEFKKHKEAQKAAGGQEANRAQTEGKNAVQVPNLNRATNLAKPKLAAQDDDELFAGSL